MDPAEPGRHVSPKHLGVPVVDGGKTAEECGRRHDEMEVTDDEQRVVERYVGRNGTQVEAGESTNAENQDRSQGKEHRYRQRDATTPHGSEPVDRQHHRRRTDGERQRLEGEPGERPQT